MRLARDHSTLIGNKDIRLMFMPCVCIKRFLAGAFESDSCDYY